MWQPASFPSSLFPFPRGSLQTPKWRILLKFQYYLEKPIRDDGLQFALDCKLDFDLFEKQQVCVSLGVCFHWMSGVCVCVLHRTVCWTVSPSGPWSITVFAVVIRKLPSKSLTKSGRSHRKKKREEFVYVCGIVERENERERACVCVCLFMCIICLYVCACGYVHACDTLCVCFQLHEISTEKDQKTLFLIARGVKAFQAQKLRFSSMKKIAPLSFRKSKVRSPQSWH